MTNYQTSSSQRKTQQQRILDLLLEGLRQHRDIGLPELLNLRIAQLNTRIKELREAGWQIVNRQEAVEGQRRSWYSLKSAFPVKVIPQPERLEPKPAQQRPSWNQGFAFGNPAKYNGNQRTAPNPPDTQKFLDFERGVRR